MNKTHAAEKNGHFVTSDFIKIRPGVRFIGEPDAIVVITAGGYRRLNSGWIKKLHEKIYPVLLNGCSRKALLGQFGDETRGALNLYLRALEQSDSFIRGNASQSGRNVSEDLLKAFSAADNFETVMIEQPEKKQILFVCERSRLLQVLDKLSELEKNRQIIVFVVGRDFTPGAHFEGIVNWHLQTEPFQSKKAFGLTVFRWDESGLSCTLKFRKPRRTALSFSDFVKEFDLISPVRDVPQLPLSVISSESGATMVSLNYKPAAESLLIGEIVRQTTGAADDSDLLFAASRLEIRAKMLDKSAARLFESMPDAEPADALNIASDVPAIAYLQTILKRKIAVLPVKKEVLANCFYRFADENHSSVSLSEKKALHDFLLFAAYSVFYPPAGSKAEKAAFHSGILTFVPRKEVGKMIKAGEKFLKKNLAGYAPEINKATTFWGGFYWGKAV